MDREDIVEFIKEVVGPNTEIVHHDKWVGLPCVFSQWTHSGGKDTHPSAGISVKPDGSSVFNCFTCGSKGTLSWFLRKLDSFTGDNHAKLIRSIEDGEFLGGSLPSWGRSGGGSKAAKTLDKETYLGLYDSAAGHWYLSSRKGEQPITDGTVQTIQLLHDPADNQGDERILFPVFGREGQLHGFTGRAVYDDVVPKVRDYHGLEKAKVLLGAHLLKPEDEYIALVEGLFDYAMMVQYGIPVVATLHSGVTEDQARMLIDIGKPLVSMFDNDDAGAKAEEVAVSLLGKHLPISSAKYPWRNTKGKRTWAKDPAGCTKKEAEWMIRHAKIV